MPNFKRNQRRRGTLGTGWTAMHDTRRVTRLDELEVFEGQAKALEAPRRVIKSPEHAHRTIEVVEWDGERGVVFTVQRRFPTPQYPGMSGTSMFLRFGEIDALIAALQEYKRVGLKAEVPKMSEKEVFAFWGVGGGIGRYQSQLKDSGEENGEA